MLIIFSFECPEHGEFESLEDNKIPADERFAKCPECGELSPFLITGAKDVMQYEHKEWKAFRQIGSLQQAQKDRDAMRPHKWGRKKEPISVGAYTQRRKRG